MVAGPVRRLIGLSTVVLAALLVAGTLVTAAGPHAGDASTPRLDIGVAAVAQLHADLLFGYLGLLVGLGFALAAVRAPSRMWHRFRALVAVVLAQGVLGALQYALGVPEVLVSLHVLGAALVTMAAAALWAGDRRTATGRRWTGAGRGPGCGADPSPGMIGRCARSRSPRAAAPRS